MLTKDEIKMKAKSILERDGITEDVFAKNLYWANDLSKCKFGRLTPVYPLKERENGQVVWYCLCDCGKELNKSSHILIGGRSNSCGCLNKELASSRNRVDLTGQKFGLLTVIENDTGKRYGRKIVRLCRCECGNLIEVVGDRLTGGQIKSCGCLKSEGEKIIGQLLREHNIKYKKNKVMKGCYFESGKPAFFDFYLLDYNIIIEYDGIQHFSYRENDNSWNNKENYEKTKFRDQFKDNWCKENNVPIIRIPYTDIKILDWNYIHNRINFLTN